MSTQATRHEFYQRLERQRTAPLWESLARLIPSDPRPAAVPAMWRYAGIRDLLMEAGRMITAVEAERRVLVLENPGLSGTRLIADSLYAGLQLVMPGEVTPQHRHTSAAMRFIVEGTGAYTTVEGRRATMHPGDFILTPSWTWHDHGNPSEEPVVWLDGLDVPIVNLFHTSFMEHQEESGTAIAGDARVFSYPYASSREALDRLAREGAPHACHGFKMAYADSSANGYPMLTIEAFLQLLPAGFRGAPYRTTGSAVYCVAEGQGRSTIGSETLEWSRSDVFVVPSWCPVTHEVEGEAVLFSFSDRPAQKALGIWREEALTAPSKSRPK